MEVFREILFLIVMAWSIPNLIFFLIKLIKKNPKIFPIIISVIISIVGLVFSITFLKNIDFFETIGKKDISEKETTNNKNSIGGDELTASFEEKIINIRYEPTSSNNSVEVVNE